MKKVFLWVVLIGVFFSFPGVAAKQENLHLLWDIPFGTPLEECAELIYEKHGIVMKEEEPHSFPMERVLISHEKQTVKFLGEPVAIRFMSKEKDQLQQINILFDIMRWEEDEEPKPVDFHFLYDQAVTKYGLPTGGGLTYRHLFDDKHSEKNFSIPMDAEEVNFQTLKEWTKDMEYSEMLVLDLAIGNITITARLNNADISIMEITFKDKLSSITGFEGADGDFRPKKSVVEIGL